MRYWDLVELAESYATDFREAHAPYQVVCIAFSNGKPFAFGINQKRYMKNASIWHCHCHAEIDLLKKIGDKARGSKIYIYRFNNSQHPKAREPKNAKPCCFCQHVLKERGVSRVYYINNNNELSVLKNRDMVSVIANPVNITKYAFDEKDRPISLKQRDFILVS